MSAFGFGNFSLNVAERSLLRRGQLIRLPQRVFDVLTLLVENRDRLVTKDELIEVVWPDAIVEESNLAVAISRLRTVLGDDKHQPKYIATVPRIGYRFVAEVRRLQEPGINSIAVLPFNQHPNHSNTEYLADGLTESLIYRLSRLPNVNVIPRSSVRRYKGKQVDSVKVASTLGVNSLITGRMVLHGEDLSISVELLTSGCKELIWGQQYHVKTANFLLTQENIVREITDKLTIQKSSKGREEPTKRVTECNEAYKLYLRGRFHWNKRSEGHLTKAIQYFKKAIKKDPACSVAYTGLADAYNMLGFYSMMAPKMAFTRAKAAAMKALALDDSIAEAHASLGFASFHHDWDWKEAEQSFKRSIEYEPNCLEGRLYYGCYLTAASRFDEAIQQYERGLEIDPLSLIANAALGYGYYFARRYDEAVSQLKAATEMDEHFEVAHLWLGWAYEQSGRLSDAIVEYEQALALSGGQTSILTALARVFALSGNKDESQRLLKQLVISSGQMFVSSYQMAYIYAALGENEKAFEYLEKAYSDRTHLLVNLQVDPKFDSLRSDPRLANLALRIVPAKSFIQTAEADEEYREGRYLRSLHTRESLTKAVEHFRRAAEMDSHQISAYRAMVDCYLRLRTNYFLPADLSRTLPVISIDDVRDKRIKLQSEWDEEAVARETKRARELNFSLPEARQWYAAYVFSHSLSERMLPKSPEKSNDAAADWPSSNKSRLTQTFRATSLAEDVQIACIVTRDQIEVGNIDAGYLMLQRWYTVGQWPTLEGLSPQSSADLLLTTGLLAGRYAALRLLTRGQKHAEALLNGAISLFEQLGLKARAAEARSELGRCYDREGMFDLARTTFLIALEGLSPEYPELTSRTLLRLAFAEMKVGHLRESLQLLEKAGDIVAASESSMADFYHIEMATTLGELAIAERSLKHFEKACDHYHRALANSEAVGHHRRTAILENNHGYLMLAFGKLPEAASALMRARELFRHFSEPCPQLDETLARFHLEVQRIDLAEEAIVQSVRSLERAGEDAVLAESLRTHGQIMCRLGRYREARRVLERAYQIAERCGDKEGAGLAVLLTIENLSEHFEDDERLELSSLLSRLLGDSQRTCVIERVRVVSNSFP